jgi:hypothetical protein
VRGRSELGRIIKQMVIVKVVIGNRNKVCFGWRGKASGKGKQLGCLILVVEYFFCATVRETSTSRT